MGCFIRWSAGECRIQKTIRYSLYYFQLSNPTKKRPKVNLRYLLADKRHTRIEMKNRNSNYSSECTFFIPTDYDQLKKILKRVVSFFFINW